MLNTTQLRQAWAPACNLRPSRQFTFWTGVRVTVDGRIVHALEALNRAFLRHHYRPIAGQTWGYNCRKITGGTGYSLHAYGIAVDVNSLSNPYGSRLVTDMPIAMIEEIEAIYTNNDKRVWGWGGRYGRNKDAMHFEIVCAPSDLATGVVDPFIVHSEPEQEDPEVLLVQSKTTGTTVLVGGGRPASIHEGDDIKGLTDAGVRLARVSEVMVQRLIENRVY